MSSISRDTFLSMLGAVMPIFNVGSSAISIGIAETATRITQGHLTSSSFEYSGMKLSDLPNERARLAEMRIETDRARAYLAATLDAIEQPGAETMVHVLASKAAAAESALRVTDTALRAGLDELFRGRPGQRHSARDRWRPPADATGQLAARGIPPSAT